MMDHAREIGVLLTDPLREFMATIDKPACKVMIAHCEYPVQRRAAGLVALNFFVQEQKCDRKHCRAVTILP